MESSEIRLVDVEPLDLRELERLLPEGTYRVEREEVAGAEHGDLGLTAVLVLVIGPPVIKALAAWLMKKRAKKSVTLSFEGRGPDGTVEKRTFTVDTTSSDPAGKDVLEPLFQGLGLDSQLVTEALKGT